MTCTSSSAGTLRLTLFKNATKSALVCRARMSVMTLPVAISKRGEQVAGAVALVVMRGPRRGGGQHRQGRRGAVERLDLRLLVDREHGGGDRRVHVQRDEVADLLDQVGVRRHLEGVLAPRLEPERPPDLAHGRVGDPVLGGQAPGRPVRRVGRRGLQRLDDDRFDHVVADGALGAGPGRVDQPVEPVGREPVPPLRHRRRVAAQLGGDLGVGRFPSAHANTIRHRNANACDDECRRAQRSSVLRSSPVKVISTVGRPRRAMVSLRCWSTTPDQRGSTAKIPDQPNFLGETTFQDTRFTTPPPPPPRSSPSRRSIRRRCSSICRPRQGNRFYWKRDRGPRVVRASWSGRNKTRTCDLVGVNDAL